MALGITMVKIRATISVGNFSVSTPYVVRFDVNKSRGQISTFDARIKVHYDKTVLTGSQLQIRAGSLGHEKLIFSGIVKKATITPCFDDPQYVMMDLSGADVMSLLQGKKFTRRCKASRSAWVSIDSVVRKGLKSGKFKYKTEDILMIDDSELDEDTNLTKAMTTTDMAPFKKIVQAPNDKTLEDVVVEAQVQVE